MTTWIRLGPVGGLGWQRVFVGTVPVGVLVPNLPTHRHRNDYWGPR